MRSLVNRMLQRWSLEVVRHNPTDAKHRQIVSLAPEGAPRGRVLLSYILDPFLRAEGAPISNDHTHFWESAQIAHAFLARGFVVDVVSFMNGVWMPQHPYAVLVAARTNLERLARHLDPRCVKVAHLDTAHWLFNNGAALQRLLDLQRRRGIAMRSAKNVEANWALEAADLGTVLGNAFTIGTYEYAGKPLHRIPISAPRIYPWNEDRDFARCRRHFLWFGSSGFVHKGLDLVLEAFAGMPDLELTVCGPFEQERAFVAAFHRELFEMPNIHARGWIDVASPEFLEIAHGCIALVYPTCSEGGGGSAITCMHAGLIPMLTPEASVDIGASGVLMENPTVESIRDAVRRVAKLPAAELEYRARNAWSLARENHTRERFAESYDAFVDDVVLPLARSRGVC